MVICWVLISDLCLLKAELKTKNSTKRQLCYRLVYFLVFNSIYTRKKKITLPGFTSTVSSCVFLFSVLSSYFSLVEVQIYHTTLQRVFF